MTTGRVVVVDYESGNLCSVTRALEKVGADVRVVNTPREVLAADAVVLPGVGAFRDAMDKLTRRDLVEPIRQTIISGKPFFGICVGMQLLFAESQEYGHCPGLGIYPGRVRRFQPDDPSLKVPHMGWNALDIRRRGPVLEGIGQDSHVYFVHSFYVESDDESIVSTTTTYGVRFVSSIWSDNVFASQFHPEKSQSVGLKMLANFVGTFT